MAQFPPGGDAGDGTHFCLLTVRSRRRFRTIITTCPVTVTAVPGDTRYDLYWQARDHMNTNYPETRFGTVIAFDIQPNKL